MVVDLGSEELEESVELAKLTPCTWQQGRRVDIGGLFDRADVELKAVSVALDAPQHSYRVADLESRRQELDVVPDASVDAAGRVNELENEIRPPAARTGALLARDRVDTIYEAILLELCDRRVRVHGGRV